MNNLNLVDAYVYQDNKKLRCGYTTGSCSAAAAKAAASMLLGAGTLQCVELMTPKGILLKLAVNHIVREKEWVSCSIQKDSGDDPDVTNGIYIHAKVSKTEVPEIQIDGGIGVGRVTKPGLQCAVGTAAINKVPRAMIEAAVKEICEDFDYHKGLKIEISVPEGTEIAKKTFNERLGIVGGISILGTSGIVEPMSETAWIDSIKAEMDILRASGRQYLCVTLGNYGEDFLKGQNCLSHAGYKGSAAFSLNLTSSLKCSNFIGDTIDYAVRIGIKGLIFVGHIGKMVKTAGGIFNTHSRYGDCRMELLCAHAVMAGADTDTLRKVMEAVTTEDAVSILADKGVLGDTLGSLLDSMEKHLRRRAGENLKVGAFVFSNQLGLLGGTSGAEELAAEYALRAENFQLHE